MTTVAPRRAKWGGYFIPVLLMIGAVVAVTNGVVPFRQILAQDRQVEAARAELAAVQAENAQLVRETEALRLPSEIERIAREDFGYVRPGDTSYVIVEPVGHPVAPEPEPVMEIESGGVLDAIWDYLTGRDLTDDG